MQWKKRRVVTTVWEAGEFTVTEDHARQDKPFRLESADAEPQWFGSLDDAKAVAELRNELALMRQDNERLREELDTRKGIWPADRPHVAPLARQLLGAMAQADCQTTVKVALPAGDAEAMPTGPKLRAHSEDEFSF